MESNHYAGKVVTKLEASNNGAIKRADVLRLKWSHHKYIEKPTLVIRDHVVRSCDDGWAGRGGPAFGHAASRSFIPLSPLPPLSPALMSTTFHTPSHPSLHPNHPISFHPPIQDMHESPFITSRSPSQRTSATPPRRQPLLLTPSPLRRRADYGFDFDSTMDLDFDDFSAAASISTPFRPKARPTSSSQAPCFLPDDDLPAFFRPPDPPIDDDEEGLFLRSSAGHTSLPLHTPERLSLDPIRVPNSTSIPNFAHAPKRKVSALFSPFISHANDVCEGQSCAFGKR